MGDKHTIGNLSMERNINNIRYADNIALIAESIRGLETLLKRINISCNNLTYLKTNEREKSIYDCYQANIFMMGLC